MRFSLFLFLLITISCGGGQKKSSFEMGKTTRKELVDLKGEPQREEEIPTQEGKILEYPGGEKYQLKGEVVVHSFRYPEGDEKLLLYWKHKFKDCKTHSKKIKKKTSDHLPNEWEFICNSQGLSVIYSEGSSYVSRVVENEKK